MATSRKPKTKRPASAAVAVVVRGFPDAPRYNPDEWEGETELSQAHAYARVHAPTLGHANPGHLGWAAYASWRQYLKTGDAESLVFATLADVDDYRAAQGLPPREALRFKVPARFADRLDVTMVGK